MNSNQRQWPGYPENDGGLVIETTLDLAKGFLKAKSERSVRVGVMLKNLAAAMAENDRAYFNMHVSQMTFRKEMEREWDSLYLAGGGEIGTGEKVKIQNSEMLKNVTRQYNPGPFMQLQQVAHRLRDTVYLEESTQFSEEELERMSIVYKFYLSIICAMTMEEKWFDKVEDSINSNAPELILEN